MPENPSRILVTGGSGKLGRELVKLLPQALHPSHKDLDLRNEALVSRWIEENRPARVVHTAAFTNVRQAEEQKENAWETNVTGTENLVHAVLRYAPEVYFVYVSTACVFFGDRGPYSETDIPHPKNFYAITKLVGETVVKRLPNWLIVRTNFVGREPWPYPKAFVDRFGTYLFADQVAAAIAEIVAQKMRGILHIAGDTKMSMLELARKVSPEVQPMSLSEYQGPPLTIDMSLSSVRWRKYSIQDTSK